MGSEMCIRDSSITVDNEEQKTARSGDTVVVRWNPNGYTTPANGASTSCTLGPAALFGGANANVAGSRTLTREARTEFTYTCTSPDTIGDKAYQGGEDSSDTAVLEVLPDVFES